MIFLALASANLAITFSKFTFAKQVFSIDNNARDESRSCDIEDLKTFFIILSLLNVLSQDATETATVRAIQGLFGDRTENHYRI